MRVVNKKHPARHDVVSEIVPVDEGRRECVVTIDQHKIQWGPLSLRQGLLGRLRYKSDVIRCDPLFSAPSFDEVMFPSEGRIHGVRT